MKIKKWILFLLFFKSLLGYTQCDILIKDFENELYRSKTLREYTAQVDNPDKVFDAWRILRQEDISLSRDLAKIKEVEKKLELVKKAGGYKKWQSLSDFFKNNHWTVDDIDLFNNTFEGAKTLENAQSWKLLKDANRTGLMNDANAVEALTKVRALPTNIKQQLGLTDEILASLNVSSKGEFAYSTLIDKITSIGKKIENYPNTKLEGFYDKVLYKLNKNFDHQPQKIGVEGMLKAVDDEFDNLLKGKIVRFEKRVDNARKTNQLSAEDLTVEIEALDGSRKTLFSIEVKNCDNCVTSKVIKEQFIERDLFNATDISQIKWKIYGQNFTKADFEKFLKENKEAIKSLVKNEKSKSNIEKWFDFKEGQSFISDEQIKIFSNTYYNKIFN